MRKRSGPAGTSVSLRKRRSSKLSRTRKIIKASRTLSRPSIWEGGVRQQRLIEKLALSILAHAGNAAISAEAAWRRVRKRLGGRLIALGAQMRAAVIMTDTVTTIEGWILSEPVQHFARRRDPNHTEPGSRIGAHERLKAGVATPRCPDMAELRDDNRLRSLWPMIKCLDKASPR